MLKSFHRLSQLSTNYRYFSTCSTLVKSSSQLVQLKPSQETKMSNSTSTSITSTTTSSSSTSTSSTSSSTTPAGIEQQLYQPIIRNGLYANPFPTWEERHVSHLFKWATSRTNLSNVPSDENVLSQTLPIVTPDFTALANPPADKIQVVWIGHASVLVQFDGLTVITDPVFSQRCAPVQWAGPKRYRPPPCTIAQLPKIDAVLISHNHYDHLDHASVVELHQRFAPKFYAPMGMASWFVNCGIPAENVVELSWWQEHKFNERVTFACTPVQHWSKRTLTDANKCLWGGWVMLGDKHKLFFSGDTGYCPVFSQVGNKYGGETGFDLALIAIGAYEPRWFMKPQHINPEEAVTIHQELRAKRSLGIHWGTFVLTDEFYLEPPAKVAEAAAAKGLEPNAFFVLKHGETVQI